MTPAELSVLAEAAAAAVVNTDPGHDSQESVERAVREAVWEAGRAFVHPLEEYVERFPIIEVD
jgi:hypothetical protein